LLAHCKLLEDAYFAIEKSNSVRRMVAELTLIRMCDSTLNTSAESMLSRIERLEDAVAGIPMPLAVPSPAPYPAEIPATDAPAKQAAPTPVASTTAPEAKAPATKPASTPSPAAPAPTGRVLHRIRGFMNCVERMRREDMLLGTFLAEGKAFTTEDGKIVIQHENEWALDMLQAASARAMLSRAFSAELKHPVDPQSFVFEVKSTAQGATDTILDDLIEAAEQ
jgi:hypothetical protein